TLVAVGCGLAPDTDCLLVTVIVNGGALAAVQLGLSGLTISVGLIVITRGVVVVFMHGVAPLLAVIVTLVVPAVVGVPEITPVLVLTDRPAGNGLALKLVGLLVAVIV